MKMVEIPNDIIEILNHNNITIHLADLEGYCRASVGKKDDGYILLVEESLSDECMLRSIRHELFHILNGDLYSHRTVDEIEANNPY